MIDGQIFLSRNGYFSLPWGSYRGTDHLERKTDMEVFGKYLEKMENEVQRSRMREILSWVKSTFPSLTPKLAWNQPMFTDHGTFIIGFSAAKGHFAVSPETRGMDAFSDAIARSGYSRTNNLFRIKWNEPVDFSLLERIIRYNIEDKKDCTAFWRKQP